MGKHGVSGLAYPFFSRAYPRPRPPPLHFVPVLSSLLAAAAVLRACIFRPCIFFPIGISFCFL